MRAIVIATALVLAGCAQQPKMMFVRTDGQLTRGNPAMAQQFEIDRTICNGETSKANMSGTQLCRGAADCMIAGLDRQQQASTVARGCMAEKGYLLVPEESAAAKAAELRAIAAASRQPAPATTAARPRR